MPEAAQDPRIEELLAGLNPPQRDAVVHGEGPLLILAGAGSGKTRVLTHRIAYLMRTKQARADEILAITFTNKAAQEMRERVELLVGRATRAMWVMTFHSACARMLRADAHRLGYTRQFTIYDAADQRRLIKRVLDDLDIDAKRFTPRAMQSQISDAKNKLRSSEDYRQLVGSYFEQTVADVYEQYERELHRMNAMDFDDLLVRSVNLLELFQEVRDRYSSAFRWILVDEYQDTNHAQYRWLQLLASEHRNLAVVGDDDQCLVEGTPITMGDGTVKPIEDVRAGDEVLSCYGSGDFRPARVTDTSSRAAVGHRDHHAKRAADRLHAGAHALRRLPAWLDAADAPDLSDVAPGNGVPGRDDARSTTPRASSRSAASRCGAMQERADAAWVIATHDSEPEARLAGDAALADVRHPDAAVLRSAERQEPEQRRRATRACIDRLFSSLDTEQGGRALLEHYGLSFDHPHHIPRGFEGRRRSVTVTLCGDRRGRTPMHLVAVGGRDPEVEDRARGRRALGPPGQGRLSELALRVLLQGLRRGDDRGRAHPGRDTGDGPADGATGRPVTCRSSLPQSVRRGMAMFTEDGGYDVVESVAEIALDRPVYDLNIEHTHNFIAGGLVTHNSIYGFSGADIKNILASRTTTPTPTSSSSSRTTARRRPSSPPPTRSSPTTAGG